MRVKAQATKWSDKFGAANAAMRDLTTSTVETSSGGNEVGINNIEGYFDNLSATAINEKSVLKQLVTNNSKIAATNKDLVVMVKKLSNNIKNF